MALQGLAQKPLCRNLVAFPRHEVLERLALLIDGAPEIVRHAVDPREHLVEVPAPMTECPHRLDPVAADLGGEDHPEAVPPEPHGLVGDVDPTLVKETLDVAQRQG